MDILITEDLVSPAIERLSGKHSVVSEPALWKDKERLMARVGEARAIMIRNQTKVTQELLAAAPTVSESPTDVVQIREAGGVEEPPIVSCPYWQRCPIRSDERCGREYPPLRALTAGHWVASFCELSNGPMPVRHRMRISTEVTKTTFGGANP